MEFSGRLNSFPMVDLLQWAAKERCTGSLAIRRSRREKRVQFEEGKVVGCISDDPAEFYGQYLLLHGLIDQRKLVLVLAHSKENGKRLGESIVSMELMTEAEVKDTLRRHLEDTVCDLFLWKHGIFFFHRKEEAGGGLAPNSIDSLALVLEGSRWVDEMGRIREVIQHDNVVLAQGPKWPGEDLTPLQETIKERLDESVTVGGIRRYLRGSYFRVLEGIFALVNTEVVAVDSNQPDPAGDSQELSIYDLLFEQAAEEQVLSAGGGMALPIDLVETFFPVWVGESLDKLRKKLRPEAHELFLKFDGSTQLADIFSSEPAQRMMEYELLLIELGKHNLALLPTPAEELGEGGGKSTVKNWWKKIAPGK